jgi:oxygen-independent coproporphyrinogen-3 oxidase
VEPVRHLYVHVPFCAHRCGYCDFVTVTGHADRHEAYVDALLREADRWRGLGALGPEPETVYLGGGTPSILAPVLLARLLDALPASGERTIECNPETVTPELAAVLADRGLRVSLGSQSFDAGLLATLERRARPETVRGAVATLRAAGIDNLSLDLIYGVPGETDAVLDADLDALLALEPEHASCYELEAKPGTRFTHRHGAALVRQAELLEGHLDRVIDRLERGGLRWYETASFARPGREAVHNSAYWLGRDYLGLGVGAVSTLGGERRANGPRLAAYLEAVAKGGAAPCTVEVIDDRTRLEERLLLGLRLADGVPVEAVEAVLDRDALPALVAHGLVSEGDGRLQLTRRGRMLANDVVSRLLRDDGPR